MGDSNDIFDSIIATSSNVSRIKEYIQKHNNTIHGDANELYTIGAHIGYVHINLEDIENMLSKGSDVFITTATAVGENCMKRAAEIASSKLEVDPKDTTYAILVVWKGSLSEFRLEELNPCLYNLVKERFSWGIYPDETLGDKIKVTLMVIV